MKLEKAMLLISRDDGAMVVNHPPAYKTDAKYTDSVGACFAGWDALTDDRKVIHLLGHALCALERFPDLKASDLLDALESIDEVKETMSHVVYGL